MFEGLPAISQAATTPLMTTVVFPYVLGSGVFPRVSVGQRSHAYLISFNK